MSDNDTARCYIGRCKCGSIVAATVAEVSEYANDPAKQKAHERRVAKDVSDFIKEGLAIEQMQVSEVRKQFANCTCLKPETKKPPTDQGTLPI